MERSLRSAFQSSPAGWGGGGWAPADARLVVYYRSYTVQSSHRQKTGEQVSYALPLLSSRQPGSSHLLWALWSRPEATTPSSTRLAASATTPGTTYGSASGINSVNTHQATGDISCATSISDTSYAACGRPPIYRGVTRATGSIPTAHCGRLAGS